MASSARSRRRLRALITEIAAAEQRAMERSWGSKLPEAEERLRQAVADAPHRLAAAYVGNLAVAEVEDPLAAARAAVAEAQAEDQKISAIRVALVSEIAQAERDLVPLRDGRDRVIAEIVPTSPAYRRLVESHSAAWRRLRSVKAALATIATGLRGAVPQTLLDEVNRSETLAADRVGYPVDEAAVARWADVLAALVRDGGAVLPDGD
jgi:hypothetical protein